MERSLVKHFQDKRVIWFDFHLHFKVDWLTLIEKKQSEIIFLSFPRFSTELCLYEKSSFNWNLYHLACLETWDSYWHYLLVFFFSFWIKLQLFVVHWNVLCNLPLIGTHKSQPWICILRSDKYAQNKPILFSFTCF